MHGKNYDPKTIPGAVAGIAVVAPIAAVGMTAAAACHSVPLVGSGLGHAVQHATVTVGCKAGGAAAKVTDTVWGGIKGGVKRGLKKLR